MPTDFFNVKIFRHGEDDAAKEEVSQGFGSWLEYLEFDKEKFWQLGVTSNQIWSSSEDRLPSDSVYRPDLRYLLQDDLENAQNYKDLLENIQRKDRSLRTAQLNA